MIRAIKRLSVPELAERRAAVVAAVREVAPLELVNGGGTGSLETHAPRSVVTEATAGSGFYAPTLFDRYASFRPRPAAMFAMPVVQRPGRGVATVLGGGYHASGARGRGPPARALPARGPAARPAGGRRRGPDSRDRRARREAADRRPRLFPSRQGRRALRALRNSPPRERRRSWTRCPPIAARDAASSSGARVTLSATDPPNGCWRTGASTRRRPHAARAGRACPGRRPCVRAGHPSQHRRLADGRPDRRLARDMPNVGACCQEKGRASRRRSQASRSAARAARPTSPASTRTTTT